MSERHNSRAEREKGPSREPGRGCRIEGLRATIKGLKLSTAKNKERKEEETMQREQVSRGIGCGEFCMTMEEPELPVVWKYGFS